jgi:hypothetical protein
MFDPTYQEQDIPPFIVFAVPFHVGFLWYLVSVTFHVGFLWYLVSVTLIPRRFPLVLSFCPC